MRLFTGLIGLGLALGFSAGVAAQFVPGDINDDGIFDIEDTVVLRRALIDLDPGIAQLCGNGIVDAGEDCDFGDLDGATCAGLGASGGTLACGAGCVFDISGCDFIDNGDGTISDNQTGLMWEQKTNDGGIHDKDDFYTWSDTGTPPDGTVFTIFLATLNDGATGCFAGHCDWRLPTLTELQTILLEPFPCSTDPCINPILGPTASTFYWSATPNSVSHAEAVSFILGNTITSLKISHLSVRAVRSGL